MLYQLIKEGKSDDEIIEYCRVIPEDELSRQILWIDEGICSFPNTFFSCIEGGKLRYKLAQYLLSKEPKVIEALGKKHKALYYILVNLSNAISFGESVSQAVFDNGVQLFTEIIQGVNEEELNLINLDHCSLGWLAIRFESTVFMKLLLDHGWKVDNRYEGLTPFLTCMVNGKYNLPMVELLLANGADINAVAQNDQSPGEKFGYHFVQAIAFHKDNCPRLPRPIGCNYQDILITIYQHLNKHDILLNHPSRHPIYNFLDYFHIPYEDLPAEDCCICFQKSRNCVTLNCLHHLHRVCGAFIQQSDGEISCPLCRQITYFRNENKLHLSIIFKTLCDEKVIPCYPNEYRISDLFEIVRENFHYDKCRLLYEREKLSPDDNRLMKSLPNLTNNSKFLIMLQL